MPLVFCPQAPVIFGPGDNSYSGYYCDGATPSGTGIEGFRDPIPPNELNPFTATCPCPHPRDFKSLALFDERQPKFRDMFERGVPNPGNPLHQPDEPQLVPVVGEYLAHYRWPETGNDYRFRLILLAFEDPTGMGPPRLQGVAFRVHPNSPPSPYPVPHFSEAKNWIKRVVLGSGADPKRFFLKINDLGLFQIQVMPRS